MYCMYCTIIVSYCIVQVSSLPRTTSWWLFRPALSLVVHQPSSPSTGEASSTRPRPLHLRCSATRAAAPLLPQGLVPRVRQGPELTQGSCGVAGGQAVSARGEACNGTRLHQHGISIGDVGSWTTASDAGSCGNAGAAQKESRT